MTIWDEIKELFLPKDELDKRKEQSYKDAKNKEKDLLDKLYKLDKEYTDSLPKKEEKDYHSMFEPFSKKEKVDNTLSNDELDNLAYKKAYKDYDKKLNNIDKIYNSNEKKARENEEKVKQTGKEILSNLDKQFAINKNNIDTKMQKQGLGFSSIKDNLHRENKKNINEKKQETNNTTKKYLENINSLIGDILNEKNDAKSNLEKESKENYQDIFNDLVKDRDSEKQKINDYNEKLKHEKIAYDNKVERQIDALKEKDRKKELEQEQITRENENKYGYTGDKKVNYDKRLNLAIEFYDSLPKELALRVANNNLELKRYLGAYYYPLVKHIESRYERKKIFS